MRKVGRTGPPPCSKFWDEKKVILIPLQLGAFALTSFYLIYSRVEMRRRLGRSWHAIATGLSPVCCETATNASSLRLIDPWVRYRDAGLMMELADYAELNARTLDHVLIADLRNDALQLRIYSLRVFLTRSR